MNKRKRELLFGLEGGQVTVMEQRKEFIQEYLTRGKVILENSVRNMGYQRKRVISAKTVFLNTVIRIWRPEQSTGKQPVKVG